MINLEEIAKQYPKQIPIEVAAAHLQISPRTLRHIIETGKTPFGFFYSNNKRKTFKVFTEPFVRWATNNSPDPFVGHAGNSSPGM